MARKVTKIDHHRNGVSGEPFYVGIIKDDDGSDKLFVHFANYDDEGHFTDEGDPRTAILDADLVGKKEIEFFVNSWRGDVYHDLVVSARDKYHWGQYKKIFNDPQKKIEEVQDNG